MIIIKAIVKYLNLKCDDGFFEDQNERLVLWLEHTKPIKLSFFDYKKVLMRILNSPAENSEWATSRVLSLLESDISVWRKNDQQIN